MSRSTILATLAAAAAVGGGVAAVLTAGGGSAPADTPLTARAGNPHARVDWKPGELKRVMNAVRRVQNSAPEADLAAQGRELFRSEALAKAGESCNGCHTDGGANSKLGLTPHRREPSAPDIASDFNGDREPIALYRVAKTAPYFWDARVDANGEIVPLDQIVVETIVTHFVDSSQAAAQAAKIVAYLKTIDAPESPFSQGTMSPAALRGQLLFQQKAGCVACHIGPEFTDNEPDNVLSRRVTTPLAGTTKDEDDPGAARNPAPAETCPQTIQELAAAADPSICSFDTPSLLGVRHTAPYFHNGIQPTLEAVVNFYNTQSVLAPLNLTAQEQADLVAFLKSI